MSKFTIFIAKFSSFAYKNIRERM